MKNGGWGMGNQGELHPSYIESVESWSGNILWSHIYFIVVAVSGFKGYLYPWVIALVSLVNSLQVKFELILGILH